MENLGHMVSEKYTFGKYILTPIWQIFQLRFANCLFNIYDICHTFFHKHLQITNTWQMCKTFIFKIIGRIACVQSQFLLVIDSGIMRDRN